MAVTRLQNLHVVAQDVPALAAFWQEALGLTLRFADGERWVQLQAGEDAFAVASVEEGAPGQRGAVPVFEVDDLASHAAAIEAHGGSLLEERDMGDHGRVLTFRDPQGNVAQLFLRSN